MSGASDEEMSIRAYLLGELPPDAQVRIEEHLLADRDLVEMLLIIEDELTDSYLRGALSDRERTEFENYFLKTPARRRKLRMAKALRRYVDNQQTSPSPVPRVGLWARVFGQPLPRQVWASAVAAVLVLGVALGIWWLPGRESLADKGRKELRAALQESPIEGRIAGFDWAPKRVTLGEQSNNVADRISLESAERHLLDAVRTRPDSHAHHALGQFYLAKRDLDSAIEQFNEALQGEEKNARLHSDLGAALLERGKASQAKGSDTSLRDFALSLERLDRALELNDSLLEARFNRALCYEYLQLPAQAESDWRNYINRDADSPWAAEARRHLSDLEERKRKISENSDAHLKEFLVAFHSDDREGAWKLVSQNRDLLRGRLIWWQLLGDFFKSTDEGALVEANNNLQALVYVGNLKLHPPKEGQRRGDPYLSELAAFYRTSSPQRRSALGQAHGQLNEGNQLLLNGQYEEATRKYTQAEDTYSRVGNRWESLLAKLLIGTSRIQKGDAQLSRPEFDAVSSLCREKGYLWLWAESCYGLGRVHDRLAEHSKALEFTTEALTLSESIDDGYNAQRSLSQIADQYRKLGNYDSSINSLNRCLASISDSGWAGARQMFRNCDQLMQLLAAKRLYAAAAAYGEEALRLAPEIEDQRFVYVSASHLGLVRARQRNYTEAITLTQQGLEAANALPDEKERLAYLAYTALQLGDLYRQSGVWDRALGQYDLAIEQSASGNIPMVAYGAHQGRLRCQIALRNDAEAEAELSQTLGLLEQYRGKILEEQNNNTFFDREQSVYDAAIDFRYSRSGDKEAAFNYLEESRARWLLDLMTRHSGVPEQARLSGSQFRTLREVQTQMPEQTQLVEYAVLDDKILICLVSKSEFSVRDVKISPDELASKVSTFRASILREKPEAFSQGQELYKLLIQPVELSPEKGEQVCIVPDKVLYSLPFVALVSPIGKYMVEDYQVTLAPSATVHLACSERKNHIADRSREHLLAVGDPSFDRSAFPSLPLLPSTRQQVQKIAELYRQSPVVLTNNAAKEEAVTREMDRADVIHLASHYVVYDGDPMNSRLLLASEARDGAGHEAGFLKADEVFALKLQRAPLVVLSACDSGVEHYYNGEGMIGMSRVFIAAGAPVVVASLWQVEAYATDELMINFHRHRKLEAVSTAEALTRAQREMLGSSKKHPYYWAGFASIGGRTDF